MVEACLYVIATPIGNREDLSPRAVRILKSVDLIACEDTRHSAPLLAEIGAGGKLLAVHDHNEAEASKRLLPALAAGQSVALISDAGTPLLSDPGFRFVQAAIAAGIKVVPVPGASALLAALSAAGLPTDRFSFEGFLPAKAAARRAALTRLKSATQTLVLFEAKHRIIELLDDAVAILGSERQAVIARELTKRHETFLRGSLAELRTRIGSDSEQQLGEFVVLIAGLAGADAEQAQFAEGRRIADLLSKELPSSRVAKLAAEISGASKNAIYDYLQGKAG